MSAPEQRRRLATVPIAGVALFVLMLEPGCARSSLPIPSTRADGGADAGADAALDAAADPAVDSGSDAELDADTDAAPPLQRDWQGPELIEDFADHSYGAHVVIDAQANVTATWRQYGGSQRREGVGANRFDRTTETWGQARYLDDGTRSTAAPTLAKDGAGNVMVVWEQTLDVGSPRHVLGKGSHRKWVHPTGRFVVMSGREGTDAKRYQEEQLDEAITAVRAAPKP